MRLIIFFFILINICFNTAFTQDLEKERLRDFGIEIGVLKPGKNNAITDVAGVKVGHRTLIQDSSIRTGVTAILPHSENIFQSKVPAAIYIGNGFGKLAGYSQVKELGNIETPIILTNTLSVPTAADALITYTLGQEGNEDVRSVNPVVGETNDGFLNDIRASVVSEKDVLDAISNASEGPVQEGNCGAGTGTSCFGYKGGIGTSSRVLPDQLGGYTVGVLVQSNFGGIFKLNGIPIAKEQGDYSRMFKYGSDGSCMIVVITDAPLDARNLERLAKRAMLGLGRTGGIASNGSGDYVIAVSTAEENRIPYQSHSSILNQSFLNNNNVTPLFLATIEATEEAILNSLFAAEDMIGVDGHERKALPKKEIIDLIRNYRMLDR